MLTGFLIMNNKWCDRNADLTVPPLLWPVKCIKLGGHAELQSGPTVPSLYCESTPKIQLNQNVNHTQRLPI